MLAARKAPTVKLKLVEGAMPRETPRRARPHLPVPVQRARPAKKRGPVTVDDVEALVRWLLDTHRYTPWFDTEAAASYLAREPGTST